MIVQTSRDKSQKCVKKIFTLLVINLKNVSEKNIYTSHDNLKNVSGKIFILLVKISKLCQKKIVYTYRDFSHTSQKCVRKNKLLVAVLKNLKNVSGKNVHTSRNCFSKIAKMCQKLYNQAKIVPPMVLTFQNVSPEVRS